MTTLDKQALEKVKDAARGWEGSSAEWIAEAAVKAYEAALPEARRWIAFYPAGWDVADLNNAHFYTSKDDFHRNVRGSEEPGMLKTIEVRDA